MNGPDLKSNFNMVSLLGGILLLVMGAGNAMNKSGPDGGGFSIRDIMSTIFGGGASTASASTPAPDTTPSTNGQIITWGDSHASALGRAFNGAAQNRGVDGAGLMAVSPRDLNNIPGGSTVIMSMGTNDVGSLIGASDQAIDAYAGRVVGLAQQVKNQGATPVIVGMEQAAGAYTQGGAQWRQPGYVDRWNATQERVDQAIQRKAAAAGIAYADIDDKIPDNARSADNLHYTDRGYRMMANTALQAAGQ